MSLLLDRNGKPRERAILVGLARRGGARWETEEHLQELALLTDTAGAEVIQTFIQDRDAVDPAYFIGRGKAESISAYAREAHADLIIFDDDLSPAQARNLEELSGKKVLDRSGLILDIFARRAKTREAKTQVELAQLNYLLPRLTRQWTHLSRQVGGIGTRGPGETQLEVDRRLVRKRISTLNRELQKIQSQRAVQRQARQRLFKIALVGYTNAGKSTLLNALTDADVFVEDRLFATLDPTIRRMRLTPHQQVLLIDTVGFIRKLPPDLVASFMSTLEETVVADLLLHVIDISHPQMVEHISAVREVLGRLHLSHKPVLHVFNKIDQLEERGAIARLKRQYAPAVFVSASKGLFLRELRQRVLQLYQQSFAELELSVSLKTGDTISRIYALADVLEIQYNSDRARLVVKVKTDRVAKIQQLPGVSVLDRADAYEPAMEEVESKTAVDGE
ncbi:MAG: GTPase HflX [Calditrichaeota bacterium]|nr:MAG: GTPase HflX [Calditrichota bacterium]